LGKWLNLSSKTKKDDSMYQQKTSLERIGLCLGIISALEIHSKSERISFLQYVTE
jgi:hypothetical protein